MIAVSPDESGAEALDWAMENLVEDGDEVVALRVVELVEEGTFPLPAPPASIALFLLLETRLLTETVSSVVVLAERGNAAKLEEFREEAREIQKLILEKNSAEEEGRRISVVVEIVAGKKTDSIVRARLVLPAGALRVETEGAH